MSITSIKPTKGWKFVDFQELWHYRDLLYFLTIRGIKAKYAQSILGVGWAIIQPLATTIVFTIVFGRIAKVASDGVPYALFSYLAMWPWIYFSGTLTESSNSLVSNSSMITKVYFPRLVLPFSAVLSKLLDFILGFIVAVGFLIYYKVTPGISVMLLPLFVVQLLFTSLGLGLIFSAMAVQYRDVRYAMTFLVQLLMYGAPVVYSTSAVPEKFRYLFCLNPMVGVIEGIRSIFLDRPIPWDWIGPGSIVSLLIFMFGLLYFRRMERLFADVA